MTQAQAWECWFYCNQKILLREVVRTNVAEEHSIVIFSESVIHHLWALSPPYLYFAGSVYSFDFISFLFLAKKVRSLTGPYSRLLHLFIKLVFFSLFGSTDFIYLWSIFMGCSVHGFIAYLCTVQHLKAPTSSSEGGLWLKRLHKIF